MDMTRARGHGFEPEITFEQGVPQVMDWYRQHKAESGKRYNVLAQPKPI
jgi:nucleoside-diphosphate-sugar epimerase